MLTITEGARAHLNEIIIAEECPDDIAVRLVLEDDGIMMALDRQQTDDTTFQHEGRTVLLLDQQLGELLGEEMLDVEDTAEGQCLMFVREEEDDVDEEDEEDSA